MKFFKWFYPGMGVKRWILLCGAGIAVITLVALYSIRIFSQTSILLASFVTAVLIFGIFLIVTAIKNILRTFVRALMPREENDLVNIVYQRRKERFLQKGPRVVVIGGGTGLSVLLQGIKKQTNNIVAIVTVTDTGGSSGILRDEFDMLPPGDIRNCLVALADAEPLMGKLFQYRFENGSGLKGHSFGNLFITALSKITGDFDKAIKESSKVLAIRGRVIPSTLEKITLIAEFNDGQIVEGETNITAVKKPLKRMRIKPENCSATREAIEALENADLIIMGPGSLYTSVLPNLLIREIGKAVSRAEAYKVYVSNIMTQPGETDNLTSEGHLQVLIDHISRSIVDVCVVNNGEIPLELIEKYKSQDSVVVPIDSNKIEALGCEVVEGDVVRIDGMIRHDPEKLAKVIFDKFLEQGMQEEK
jgi:uncharacterized cofD-like protein